MSAGEARVFMIIGVLFFCLVTGGIILMIRSAAVADTSVTPKSEGVMLPEAREIEPLRFEIDSPRVQAAIIKPRERPRLLKEEHPELYEDNKPAITEGDLERMNPGDDPLAGEGAGTSSRGGQQGEKCCCRVKSKGGVPVLEIPDILPVNMNPGVLLAPMDPSNFLAAPAEKPKIPVPVSEGITLP